MKAWLSWGAGLLLLTAAACADSSDRPVLDPDPLTPSSGTVGQTGGGEQTTETIRFAPSVQAAETGDFVTKYGLLDVRDVIAAVPVAVEPGIQFLRLDIALPEGTPYISSWQAYTADPDPPQFVSHPTTDAEVVVTSVVELDGEPHIFYFIAVAGTEITQYNLTGVYSVEARLGVEDVPPSATGTFEIFFDPAAFTGGEL